MDGNEVTTGSSRTPTVPLLFRHQLTHVKLVTIKYLKIVSILSSILTEATIHDSLGNDHLTKNKKLYFGNHWQP